MADAKISALPASTTPLAGTEVLPIVQGSQTRQVSVANLTAGRSVGGTSFVPSGATIPTNGVYLPAANSVAVATNTTERMRIDSAGNVGVGTTSTVGKLNVNGNLAIANGGWYGFGDAEERISGNNIGLLQFFTSGLECIRVFPTGGVNIQTLPVTDPGANNLLLGAGNLVIGTAGKGIDFSADPAAAGMTSELLDDYEEGTWTPDTSFLTIVGTASSEGTYTKIGRTVVVRGSVAGSTSVTVGASGILAGGLPFTTATDSIGTMAASTNVESGNIRATGPFLVATNAITPVASITFTAIYFV